jgi:hypothetical protein
MIKLEKQLDVELFANICPLLTMQSQGTCRYISNLQKISEKIIEIGKLFADTAAKKMAKLRLKIGGAFYKSIKHRSFLWSRLIYYRNQKIL